jgi:hypothetical protein
MLTNADIGRRVAARRDRTPLLLPTASTPAPAEKITFDNR